MASVRPLPVVSIPSGGFPLPSDGWHPSTTATGLRTTSLASYSHTSAFPGYTAPTLAGCTPKCEYDLWGHFYIWKPATKVTTITVATKTIIVDVGRNVTSTIINSVEPSSTPEPSTTSSSKSNGGNLPPSTITLGTNEAGSPTQVLTFGTVQTTLTFPTNYMSHPSYYNFRGSLPHLVSNSTICATSTSAPYLPYLPLPSITPLPTDTIYTLASTKINTEYFGSFVLKNYPGEVMSDVVLQCNTPGQWVQFPSATVVKQLTETEFSTVISGGEQTGRGDVVTRTERAGEGAWTRTEWGGINKSSIRVMAAQPTNDPGLGDEDDGNEVPTVVDTKIISIISPSLPDSQARPPPPPPPKIPITLPLPALGPTKAILNPNGNIIIGSITLPPPGSSTLISLSPSSTVKAGIKIGPNGGTELVFGDEVVPISGLQTGLPPLPAPGTAVEVGELVESGEGDGDGGSGAVGSSSGEVGASGDSGGDTGAGAGGNEDTTPTVTTIPTPPLNLPPITLFDHTYTTNPTAKGYIIEGQTLRSGDVVTISGTPISLGDGKLVVGSVTSTFGVKGGVVETGLAGGGKSGGGKVTGDGKGNGKGGGDATAGPVVGTEGSGGMRSKVLNRWVIFGMVLISILIT